MLQCQLHFSLFLFQLRQTIGQGLADADGLNCVGEFRQLGIEQVETAYAAVFQAIDLNVEFEIVEIEVVSDAWAFARTNSAGTTTINATGDKVAEGNQELFVLRKVEGDWKIARYGFSTTNPRQ